MVAIIGALGSMYLRIGGAIQREEAARLYVTRLEYEARHKEITERLAEMSATLAELRGLLIKHFDAGRVKT